MLTDLKTIQIEKTTRTKLISIGKNKENYDDIIYQLLYNYHSINEIKIKHIDMKSEKTCIKISKTTWEKLSNIGHKLETYNDIILRLLGNEIK